MKMEGVKREGGREGREKRTEGGREGREEREWMINGKRGKTMERENKKEKE